MRVPACVRASIIIVRACVRARACARCVALIELERCFPVQVFPQWNISLMEIRNPAVVSERSDDEQFLTSKTKTVGTAAPSNFQPRLAVGAFPLCPTTK